jgi:transposase
MDIWVLHRQGHSTHSISRITGLNRRTVVKYLEVGEIPTHGFVLLAAHEGLPHTTAELAKLYRAKDTIEKDFKIIKDVVELQPIYHYTDPKVRAHVTICMLALLLKRSLELKLAAFGRPMTAAACFEKLSSCHLNIHQAHEVLDSVYSVTEPNKEQKLILSALGLSKLTEHRELGKQIKPR